MNFNEFHSACVNKCQGEKAPSRNRKRKKHVREKVFHQTSELSRGTWNWKTHGFITTFFHPLLLTSPPFDCSNSSAPNRTSLLRSPNLILKQLTLNVWEIVKLFMSDPEHRWERGENCFYIIIKFIAHTRTQEDVEHKSETIVSMTFIFSHYGLNVLAINPLMMLHQ